MPSFDESYPRLVAALADCCGQRAPAPERDSLFGTVLAAGLDRDHVRGGAEFLITALDRSGLLDPAALAAAAPDEIRDTLQEAGIKLPATAAALLVRLARWYASTFREGDDPADERGPSTSLLRRQLARVNGVGPATAQAILLSLGRPVYPLDRGTYRVLVRHGWTDCATAPDEIGQHLCQLAGDDCHEIARLARALSNVGRQFCGPGKPKCTRCPLKGLLPENGPLEPEN
jgi:endonuclease III related protein